MAELQDGRIERQSGHPAINPALQSCAAAILQSFHSPRFPARVEECRMRLRTFNWLVTAGLASLVLVAACSAPPPAAPPPPKTESPFLVTATIKDVMDSMVDPSSDYLWESVATIVTKQGTEERQPRTDDDWKKVRRSAITLIEATNILVMEGRKVAKPGEKSENPGIELGPEEIQKVIDDDRASFIKFAHALHDAGVQALTAIDAKSATGLSDAGETIDTACENCHLKYWYPLSAQASSANKAAADPKNFKKQ
jgi:hypothetical protein